MADEYIPLTSLNPEPHWDNHINALGRDIVTAGADRNLGGHKITNCSGVLDPDGNPLLSVYAAAFDFTPIQPGGSLTGGSPATVTLPDVPPGLNGSDDDHYIYISGGSGTPEAVLITGGTATAGGSGTIQFTPANNHTGAWTISSATAGIQEAYVDIASQGGGIVYLPAGELVLFAPVFKPAGVSVTLIGAGQDATVVRVAATQSGDAYGFALTHPGVFCIPDDGANYAAHINSGGYRDFTVSFYHPDSLTIGDYIQWPPAFYGDNVNRPHYIRVRMQGGWDGIKLTGGHNGPLIDTCDFGCFHRNVWLDNMVDSSRIRACHFWPYTTQVNSSLLFMNSLAVYGLYVGKADDLKVSDCTFVVGKAHKQLNTGGGEPWVTFDNCDFDNGGIEIEAGKALFGCCNVSTDIYAGLSITGKKALHLTGGEIICSGVWFSSTNASNVDPLVDVDFGTNGGTNDTGLLSAQFNGCRFFGVPDVDCVYVHTSTSTKMGSVQVVGCRFVLPGSQGAAWSSACINAVGTVRVLATGNVVTDKKGSTGSWFKADADSGHNVYGNTAISWSMVYPTTQKASKFADNTGVNNFPSATTIASGSIGGFLNPPGCIFHVSGTALIHTIDNSLVLGGTTIVTMDEFTIVPDGAFTMGTTGNIITNVTAVVGRPLIMKYDPVSGKWCPSYV